MSPVPASSSPSSRPGAGTGPSPFSHPSAILRARRSPRKGLNPPESFSMSMPKKPTRKKGGKKSAKKKAYYAGRKEKRARK